VETFRGTAKDDILFVSARGSLAELLGLEGNDYLDATTGAGNNILRGGDGNDQLYAYVNDQLFGDAGSDELYSDGNGANSLYGGDANDTIFADRNDFVFGDAGDDLIFGGLGANKLTGGLGKDSFYLTPNGVPDIPNEILDFAKDDDTILVTAIPEVQSFADLTRVQVGSDTVLRASGGAWSET
jgi:Ca2+-binding RTX toxin-like protein